MKWTTNIEGRASKKNLKEKKKKKKSAPETPRVGIELCAYWEKIPQARTWYPLVTTY